ncbi:MAG: hypothetical protein B7Y21_07310 [Hydrogenophilales bacterium 16-61-112]|nr:MAG: hypothetical protein B7Y21_07310 [Hydrogenophilales bacterium 16-61-112]
MDKQALVKKWTPSPLTLILLGLIAWLWFRPPADVSDDNRSIPAWQVVLVNFWASWCPYCRKEKPVIDAFWKETRGRGFEVISISIDDSPETIAAWMKDKGYTFMAAPTNASVVAAFGNVSSVPTSFILDADGHIRHKVAGQLHAARLEKLVTPLLKTPARSTPPVTRPAGGHGAAPAL